MPLPTLIDLFGKEATQNPALPFSRHFFIQTVKALESATTPPILNPYLQQVLLGTYSSVFPPWITQPNPHRKPKLSYACDPFLEVLKDTKETYDFIHLSNILDWLSTRKAKDLLQETVKKLKKGGYIFIRQLNSSLNIKSLSTGISWDPNLEEDFLKNDRSFFYKKLHVGRVL